MISWRHSSKSNPIESNGISVCQSSSISKMNLTSVWTKELQTILHKLTELDLSIRFCLSRRKASKRLIHTPSSALQTKLACALLLTLNRTMDTFLFRHMFSTLSRYTRYMESTTSSTCRFENQSHIERSRAKMRTSFIANMFSKTTSTRTITSI